MRIFKNKETKRRIESWFGRQWVKAIALITRPLSLGGTRKLARVLGKMAFLCIPRHRRTALKNIELIYGKEKPKKELRRIGEETFIHASIFAWEFLYYYSHNFRAKDIRKLVKGVEGLEHLKEAYARGNGVIAIGAHLGNFVLLGSTLRSFGFSSTSIMRQMRDSKLENMLNSLRIGWGENWIPKLPVRRAIKESISWLREGKLLMLYMDQRSGKGVTVDFMGIPTPTPSGAAVFALKTGAAVLPVFNVRDTKGDYKLVIGEEVEVTKTGDQKKDIFENTARFNKAIEKYIHKYPYQWFWFHNRWKGVIK